MKNELEWCCHGYFGYNSDKMFATKGNHTYTITMLCNEYNATYNGEYIAKSDELEELQKLCNTHYESLTNKNILTIENECYKLYELCKVLDSIGLEKLSNKITEIYEKIMIELDILNEKMGDS